VHARALHSLEAPKSERSPTIDAARRQLPQRVALTMPIPIRHIPAQSRFETTVEGRIGALRA
jgi:hypothetical protein